MIKQMKMVGVVLTAGALAACAQTPLNNVYGGSQPVYGANTSYSAPPPAPVYNAPPVYNDNTNTPYNNPPAPTYNAASGTTWGTVARVDNLGGQRKDTGLGAVIGAGVGAIAGNQIGRTMNNSKTTGTVVGAVGGGLIGNAIERNQNANAQMLRVYVRLEDGSERSWDVPSSQLSPSVGQRLRIQNDQLYAQ